MSGKWVNDLFKEKKNAVESVQAKLRTGLVKAPNPPITKRPGAFCPGTPRNGCYSCPETSCSPANKKIIYPLPDIPNV